MSFHDPQSITASDPAPATFESPPVVHDGETPSVEVLPTMADLDRLAADLDRVDQTLAELDGLAGVAAS